MNESLVKADIFFVVTTVAVVVISVGLAVVIYYAIKISKDLSFLSEKAKEEGVKILEDVKLIRETGESKAASFLVKAFSVLSLFSKKSKTNKKKNN